MVCWIIINVIDYRNTSICITCVGASRWGSVTGFPSEKKLQLKLKKPHTWPSKVWKYFPQIPNNVVLRKLCKLKMTYHSITTAMHKHLKQSILERFVKTAAEVRQHRKLFFVQLKKERREAHQASCSSCTSAFPSFLSPSVSVLETTSKANHRPQISLFLSASLCLSALQMNPPAILCLNFLSI